MSSCPPPLRPAPGLDGPKATRDGRRRTRRSIATCAERLEATTSVSTLTAVQVETSDRPIRCRTGRPAALLTLCVVVSVVVGQPFPVVSCRSPRGRANRAHRRPSWVGARHRRRCRARTGRSSLRRTWPRGLRCSGRLRRRPCGRARVDRRAGRAVRRVPHRDADTVLARRALRRGTRPACRPERTAQGLDLLAKSRIRIVTTEPDSTGRPRSRSGPGRARPRIGLSPASAQSNSYRGCGADPGSDPRPYAVVRTAGADTERLTSA